MTYDCDTRPYWVSEENWKQVKRKWGRFIEAGKAYQIDDPNTPRPWLNYLCNDTFGAVISNRGLGFHWLFSTLLRITKYEHPIDYLPRDFEDGRACWIEEDGCAPVNVFSDTNDLICVHRPGISEFSATIRQLHCKIEVFVPPDMPGEIIRVTLKNPAAQPRSLRMRFEQTWSFATFGIHTAEEGIPYLSTPGTAFSSKVEPDALWATCADPALPFPVHGCFGSPGALNPSMTPLEDQRKDGRTFRFHHAKLEHHIQLAPGAAVEHIVFSGAAKSLSDLRKAWKRLQNPSAGKRTLRRTASDRKRLTQRLTCTLPDKPLQHFLNTWFRHQLHLTFHFTRSGHSGYRDSIQDMWGYTLLDPPTALKRLLTILAHQRADGTAPRQFSNFGDGKHDHRNFMDSGGWLAEALVDYLRETGDFDVLKDQVPYLDGGHGTVDEHVWRAGQALFEQRGQHGACLTGDGDWNDALEGISRDGDAVSLWLTIALYHAHRQLIDLYDHLGDSTKRKQLEQQAEELHRVINNAGWDGAWYRYGFTGSGKPIGSAQNKEGRIHLNAQTWAVFSGAAPAERAVQAMQSVDDILQTPLGAVLLHPPYVEEADEVGRIAKLEPGTFENGSIYMHAVAFQVRAYLALNRRDDAWRTLKGLLPTNPDNPDARRTSEPYATGNYYCGPQHARHGQNFFTWFTGNPAWLLRTGFDDLLGVKADFNGLRIDPRPPAHWRNYRVVRTYRGCRYTIAFSPTVEDSVKITLNDKEIEGTIIPVIKHPSATVHVHYPASVTE